MGRTAVGPPVVSLGLTVPRSEVKESAVSAFHDVCLFRWCQLADFFCQPVKSWNGLILRKPIDMEKRD